MKIFLPFAMLALVACGPEPPAVRDISPDELLAGPPAGAVVLDVRTPEEFASGHVPGAVNIPHDALASRLGELGELGAAPDAPVVVYCERGGRAGKAADVLLAAGYTDVRHLAGDMSEWRSERRPVETAADAAGGSSP